MNSIFKDAYSSYLGSKLKSRLDEKYKNKPFYQKYKEIRLLTLIGSYFLNIFSALTAFAFVFFFILSFTNFTASIILTCIVLFCIELTKRVFLPFGIREIQLNGISISSLFKILLVGLLSTTSIILSYNGAEKAVSQFKQKPSTISIDSLTTTYEKNQLILLEKQKEIYKTQNWNGKLTKTGQSSFLEIENQLTALSNTYTSEISEAKLKNEEIISSYSNTTSNEAYIFAIITFILELLFIGSIIFLEFYDYMSYHEFKEISKKNDNRNKNESYKHKKHIANYNVPFSVTNDEKNNSFNHKNYQK